MQKTFLKAIITGIIVMFITGCGNYNKLLKSNDHDLQYYTALEYYEAGKYQKALQLFEIASPHAQGTTRDDSLGYYYTCCFYKMGDFETSSMLFNEFRQMYTNSVFLEDVEYMYARSFYFMSIQSNRDQTATVRALMAIDEYLERYPNSVKKEAMQENVDELTQKLHDKTYINAKLYYTIGRYKAAVTAIKNAINQYPESSHREELLYLIAKSNYKLAENSYEDLQRDRYMDMIDNYYTFISEYPESKYNKELDKLYKNAQNFIDTFKETGDSDSEIKEINDIIN